MRKVHWLRNTLIVLLVCGLLGTVLAAILFFSDPNKTYASAIIQFSFTQAGEGKAPNGYPYDVNGIKSNEVINKALELSELTGQYSVEQLQDNLTVSGIYSKDIIKRMTQYESLLDMKADALASVTDYKATEYKAILYNDFDNSISSNTLTRLLENILSAYRNSFARIYGVNLENDLTNEHFQELDYAQQLEALSESAKQGSRYAREMAEMEPGFMMDGKSFSSIAVRYDSIRAELDQLYAKVTLNGISKDLDGLQAKYKAEIHSLQMQMESLTKELELIEEQIKAYEKDGIIYVNTSQGLKKIGNDMTGTYDKLVSYHKDVTDQIATTKAKMSLYQERLEDLANTIDARILEGTNSATDLDSEKGIMQKTTEKKIEELIEKKDEARKEFAMLLTAYSTQEINENTITVSAIKYYTPSLFSVEFIFKALKTAGPFCMLGVMVCLVLMINNRRKEEKTKE